MNVNTTIDRADMQRPEVAPTVRDLKLFTLAWLASGAPLGVNGAVRRRWYVRWHKLWEYSRGLAYTGASRPARKAGQTFSVLDVGGAMTLPVFYLASLGDRVCVCDIDEGMTAQTARIAEKKGLPVDARTTDLASGDPEPGEIGPPEGFDRVYSFCVIEHILPPGQERAARNMARLLRPGGMLCLTFDFGEHAPTESPLYTLDHVAKIRDAIGLPLVGDAFEDNGKRFPLNRRHPDKQYTFGSLFFRKPL